MDYNIYVPGLNLNRCLSLWFDVNTPMERTCEDLFGTSLWPGFSKTSSRYMLGLGGILIISWLTLLHARTS